MEPFVIGEIYSLLNNDESAYQLYWKGRLQNL